MKKIYKAIGKFFIAIIVYVITFIDFLNIQGEDEKKIFKVVREIIFVIIVYLISLIDFLYNTKATPGKDVNEDAWWHALLFTIVAWTIVRLFIAYIDKKDKNKDNKK